MDDICFKNKDEEIVYWKTRALSREKLLVPDEEDGETETDGDTSEALGENNRVNGKDSDVLQAMKVIFEPFFTVHKYAIQTFNQMNENCVYLEEIRVETCKAFTKKSEGLTAIPKTPAEKKQRGRKKKLEEIKDDEVLTLDGATRKGPRQLKFENESEETIETEEVSQSGRPMRRCRSSRNVTQAAKPPQKRQSRKPTKRQASSSSLVPSEPSLNSPNTAAVQETEARPSDAKASKSKRSASSLDSPVTLSAQNTEAVPSGAKGRSKGKKSAQKLEEKSAVKASSPCVKDLTEQYETMLKKHTPVIKGATSLKPRSGSPVVTRGDSARKDGLVNVASSPSVSRPLGQSGEKTRQRPRSRSRNVEEESTQEVAAKKPRTRLRLNKKKQSYEGKNSAIKPNSSQDEQDKETVTDKLGPQIDTTSGSEVNSDQEEAMNTGEVAVRSALDSTTEHDVDDVEMVESSICDETQVVVSEHFELYKEGTVAKLTSCEIVKTKTTPIKIAHNKLLTEAKQGSEESNGNSVETSPVRSTRTRARANANNKPSVEISAAAVVSKTSHKDSGVRTSYGKADSTFTMSEDNQHDGVDSGRSSRTRSSRLQGRSDSALSSASSEDNTEQGERPAKVDRALGMNGRKPAVEELPARSTRTRQRVKEPEPSTEEEEDEPPIRSTRTRQRAQEPAKPTSNTDIQQTGSARKNNVSKNAETAAEELPARSTRTRQRMKEPEPATSTEEEEDEAPVRSTRTRQRAQKASPDTKSLASSSDEQQKPKGGRANESCLPADESSLAGSVSIHRTSDTRRGSKRLPEHGRGVSPAPKRQRSIVDASLHNAMPLSTSSPVRTQDERRDRVSSGQRTSYLFNAAHKKPTGFLNRTPGFSQTSMSRINSFLGTPQSNVRSFLKKASPSPLRVNPEDRLRMFHEKQKREEERVKKQRELRQHKLQEKKQENQRRIEQVLAAKGRLDQEHKQKKVQEVSKKMETVAITKSKSQEEREREEAEKRKLRAMKQQVADEKRRKEEIELERKRIERETELRRQQDEYEKRRREEEAERRKRKAEENEKLAKRLAEIQAKTLEEKERIKKAQLEKEIQAEKARIEREKAQARERKERERIEREKKLEREKKEMQLNQQLEERKLLQMQQLQKKREAVEGDQKLLQMIESHNKSIQGAGAMAKPSLNTTHTLPPSKPANVESYEITPKKVPVPSDDPNNYKIDDKESDDSSDDEDAPKKAIPAWAVGSNLTLACIEQFRRPPDLNKLFPRDLDSLTPDLEQIFSGMRGRRPIKARTSSAIWHSPPANSFLDRRF